MPEELKPINLPGKPRKFIPLDSSGPAQSSGSLAYRQSKDTLESLFASVPIDTGAKQSTRYQSEVDDLLTGRYNNVIYGANNEDIYGRNQSALDRAVNGTLKGVELAATTFVGSVGLLYGIGKSFYTGKLSDVWKNEVSESLDAINKEVDNIYLPNYYSNKEANAAWYSSDNLLTTNFLFDKLVKNTGFAVGAIYSGNLIGKGIAVAGKSLGGMFNNIGKYTEAWKTFSDINKGTARLFSQGQNIKAAEILKKTINTVADAEKASAEMLKISKQFTAIESVQDFTRKSIMSLYSSAGEASFESIGTASSFRENKIQEFRDRWGFDPGKEELDKIDQLSKDVGNVSFMANMAVLSATEFQQLPYLYGSSYKAGKATSNAFREAGGVVAKDGVYAAKAASRLSKGKSFVTSYIFDPKESLQEYLQSSIDVGVQDYYNKAYEGKEAKDLTEAFINAGTSGLTALKETLMSKEGGESILLGGITGGLMQAKGKIREGKYKTTNTNSFLQELNVPESTFTNAFNDRVNSLQRGIVLQQKGSQALEAGDKLEFLDNKHDSIHNYLSARIKYGRTDMVLDDVAERKMQASTNEGYKKLQANGDAPMNLTREQYTKKLNEFATYTKSLTSLYESANLRYQGKLNDKNERMYSDVVIDKMVYAAGKITDYDKRIPQINSSLIEAGITKTQDILDSIIKDNKPNKQATVDALNEINNLNVIKETKDELKQNLSDIIDLALRRKLFIEQHNDIVDNPGRYESKPQIEFGETREIPVKVAQKNDVAPEKKLTIGKEYSLAEPFRKEGTQLQLAPKITVLSQTLGGELEVRLPNGKTSFMTPEEFKKYNISDTNNTSQEMADVLDKAIATVLKDDKYADLRKELADASKNLGDKKINTLAWINSLDDKSLIDAVEEEFNAQTKQMFEKRDKLIKEAEQLKKNKEEITKQQTEIVQDSGTVGTNNPANDKVVPEGRLKDAKILFISTTSAGEDNKALDTKPHELRSREFLNNIGGFKNKNNMRVILVTPELAKAYGLEGLVQMSYDVDETLQTEAEKAEFLKKTTNLEKGFIGAVYVEQVGDKLFFVDKDGNQLTEVGQKADLNKIVFSTMPSNSLSDSYGNRFRSNQEEEAKAYKAAWTKQRADIFATDPTAPPTVYGFQVSRGVPEKGDVNNHIAGILINKDNEARILATDQTLIQIPTVGVVAHHTGQINMPNGRPVIVHQNNVEFLNNIQFKGKKAEAIYEVINQIATEINEQSKAGKKILINKKLSRFLQNVLYWRLGKTEPESNQINIAEDGSSISFSGNKYTIPEIAERKDEIIEDIEKAFHNINNKTLSAEMFSKPFTEYYMKNGVLVSNEWTNYQTYLLSSTYPNGSARSVEDTPLSTKIVKPTDAVPYTHKQKYATLIGLELPVGAIAKPATVVTQAPATQRRFDYEGEDNIASTPFGDIIFTVKGDEAPMIDEEDDLTIEARDKIIAKIKSKEGNESLTDEELIPQAMNFVRAYVNKELEADRAIVPQAAAPVVVAPVVQPTVTPTEAKTATEVTSEDINKRVVITGTDGGFTTIDTSNIKNENAGTSIDVRRRDSDDKYEVILAEGDTRDSLFQDIEFNGGKSYHYRIKDKKTGEVFYVVGISNRAKGTGIDNERNGSLFASVKDDGNLPSNIRTLLELKLIDKFNEKSKTRKDIFKELPESFVKEVNNKNEKELAALEGKSVTPTASVSDVEEQRAEAIAKIYSLYNQAYQMQKELAKRGKELDPDSDLSYVLVLKDPIAYLQKDISNFKLSVASTIERLENSKKSREELIANKDKITYKEDFEKQLKELDDKIKSDETFVKDYTKAIAENEQLVKDINALQGTTSTEAPKEPGSFNVKNVKKRGNMFRKVGVLTKMARMTDADLKAFKEWHAEKLPTIPFEVLENMININSTEKAWGVFENGVAKFVKGGLRGTEYHEVGEAIWNGMLTPEEQAAILADERKRPGQFTDRETGKKYNYDDVNVSDQILKERILDDFSDFRVGKLPATSLGGKIVNFFRRLLEFFKQFVTKPSMKEQLFKAIEAGEFKDRQLSTESKSMPPQYRAAGHLTEEQTNAYVKDMTILASAIILGNGDIGTIDKSAIYNLRSLTSDDVFSKIKELYTEQEVMQEIGEIAWKALVVKTKQQLKTLLKVDFNEEDLVNINEGETNRNDYAKEPFSVDYKKSAPMGIKFVSATLPEALATNQENSTSFKLPELKVNPKTQTYSLLGYTRVFSTMMDKLKNTTSIGKAISKLVGLANEDANYVRMFQRIGGNLENKTVQFKDFKLEDWRLFIEMMQTYTKQKPNAVIQYISQGQVYSGSAMVTGIVNITTRGWIQKMRDLAKEADSVISWDSVDKTYSITDLSGIPIDNPEQKVIFLSNLGITFPIEAFNKLKEEQQEKFTLAVNSLKKYLQEAKEIMSIKKETLDVAGQYNTLAELLVSVTHPNLETTRVNLDGKQSNSFADNNTPSVFENEFNEVATLDELLSVRPELRDIYSKGSQLLKKGGRFFDKEGNRTSLQLKVGYIEGTKNKDDNKGTTSVKLTEGSRFTQELNQNLNGQYYIMIPADGSTEWMMNLGNNVAFEDVEQGKDGWKKINEIFRGYLTDDIALALDADNRKQLKNVGSKAKELRFFKDILSEKTLSAINQMIADDSTQIDIEKFIDDNIDDVNDSIKKYIDVTVEETRNILTQKEQIKFVSRDAKTGVGYYKYEMLDDDFTKKEGINKNKLVEDDITNILTFANANYIINNIEYHKILFGDPFQFTVKEDGSLDATKRFKSFLSPRRTTIDSPELNTFLNEEFNKAGDIELQPGEPGYHEYKAWINTVTVSDVTIAGSVANMQNVSEEVKKAFAKTNEGDASSIIMDGTYKELKMKNGQWSPEAEAWHQWQMAYTRQNMPGFKYSEDNRGRILKGQDIKLLEKKEPKYTIEVVKPIVSGVTSGTNKINLILDKFSQMPLYYSMVKGTNLEKLYTKMMAEKKGYIIMISGRKVGAEALHDLYTPKGEFNDAAFNNNIEVSWKSYGIQVENSYEGDKQQTRGSQLTKLSTLDLYSNGEPIGDTPERKEAIANEVKRNKDILDRLHKNGYERFLKRLGIEDLGNSYKIRDKRALAKTLQDEMFRRELSDNVIDSLQLDENREFIIPFEASPAYLQIKSVLYSFIDKEITSPKVSGGSYVQAPVTMWEDSKVGRKIAIKTEDGYKQITRQEYDTYSPEEQKKVVLTDDTLKFYEDADGKRYCEVMLPHWFKSKLGKHASKSDKELIQFLNSTKEGKELLSGIGFRIPTQSLSSVEAFRVKGFLPQYMGKTVVVPSEITTKAGSDFDIDKLNMYLKAIYNDKYGEIRIIKLKGTEEATRSFYGGVFEEKLAQKRVNKLELLDTIDAMLNNEEIDQDILDKYEDYINELFSGLNTEEQMNDVRNEVQESFDKLTDSQVQNVLKQSFMDNMYRRALENEYYDSLEKLVTLPENFQRLISPVNDDGLKEISNKLDKLRGYNENNIKNRLLNRNYMTSLRHAFVTAKKWVGIAAVNITGHSLTQKFKAYIDPARFNNVSAADRKILKYGDGEILLDHNKLEKDGQSYISLSGRFDTAGKFISDGLSGFATSFVDVAKDPYILKIIKSDLAVGTFMFLRRVGVPKEQLAMFMNQPIIDEYLTTLDNRGIKDLFNSKEIIYIQARFPTTAKQLDVSGFNKEELADNIENYYAKKDLGDYKNREQQNIFNEFLKYAKMAEYSFNFTQASNYDTTKFKSGDSLQLKQWRTETAQKKNIISSVGDLLENSFIGVQADYLDKSMDAIGEALVLETPEFTDVTNEVLKSFEQDKYLSKDKFDRIANKIKAAFLDYIIQKRSDVAVNLKEQLVDDKKSVAQMLIKAQRDFPGVQILEDLEVDSSGRVGGAQTIKLKVNDKIAYTENMYQGMMRELRDDPRTNALYKGIVRLAILQGTYQSPISIKNIIPVEDYAAHITPILSGLKVDDEIRAFAKSNEFQRNEWQDNDVVPIVEPRFSEEYRPEEEYDLPRKFQGLFKVVGTGKTRRKVPGPFPTITELGVNTNKRHLMFINSKYQAKASNYDVIKVPRTVPIDKKKADEGKIDMATGLEITNQIYAEKAKKGDTSLKNFYGYQKVKYADGSPLIAYYDDERNPVYIYKAINLHGDGMYASEYYGDGRPSIFSNGSQKNVKSIDGTIVSNEIADQDIINYYGGEEVPQDEADPIIATIEKETEVITPTQPTSITMKDFNIKKIKAGTKTTTTRSEREFDKIGIPVGRSATVSFGGQDFTVTNRGFLTVQEAGGKEAMLKSEGYATVDDLLYQQTKDWINGKGKLYVYDIKPAGVSSKTVAIIGTAGRNKVPTLQEWNSMLRDAESRVNPSDILISGGAAFADHIAVKLFLEGKVKGLKLRLPASIKNNKFLGGYKTAGGTANYYHEAFSKVIGVDTIAEIQQAINKGADVTYETETSNKAMFARNAKVAAESNAMIAYTYGEENEPADGGTKDTWDSAKYTDKTHVSISKIKSTQPTAKVGKKELFTAEKGIAQKSFRGKPLNFVDKIDSKKETVLAMSNNRQTGIITIDQKGMEKKFDDKAWTKPAKQLDGSFATALSENEFGTFNEWFTFALIHESKHDTILQQEGETTGQYEDRINQAALEDLRKNYNIPTKQQFDPNNENLEGGDEPNPCGI